MVLFPVVLVLVELLLEQLDLIDQFIDDGVLLRELVAHGLNLLVLPNELSDRWRLRTMLDGLVGVVEGLEALIHSNYNRINKNNISMAFSHLINCLLLAYGPYFVVYRTKQLYCCCPK